MLNVAQPLRGQAFKEIFEMLDHLFGWKSILANSYKYPLKNP